MQNSRPSRKAHSPNIKQYGEYSKPVLFLVDDMDTFRELGFAIFSKDFEVQLYHCGKKLLDSLKLGIKPDVILLDIEMPEMNGIEVLQLIKNSDQHSQIPVIMLTGMSKDIEKQCYQHGAIDVLYKPTHSKLLIKLIKMHLTIIDLRNKINEKAMKYCPS